MFSLTPFSSSPYKIGRRDLDMRKDPWDIDKMFDSMWKDFYNFARMPSQFSFLDNEIKVDIKENEKEYVVEAEIPGVEKDDITLELRDDILTLSVEKKDEIEENKENYIRRERYFGNLCRSFYVDDVDGEKVNAKFEKGILYVTLPKKEPSSPKKNQIPIE